MEELLNVKEMAKLLGISHWTLYQWVSQKYVPFVKLRGALKFRASEVNRWINKNVSPGRSLHRLKIEEGMYAKTAQA